MTNICIAGGRDFKDYDFLEKYCQKWMKFLNLKMPITVVCGMAPGADMLGYDFAKKWGFEIKECPALWDDLTITPCVVKTRKDGTKYNAAAGPNRNEEMARISDVVIVFWDGVSSGSKSMIDISIKLGKEPIVVMTK